MKKATLAPAFLLLVSIALLTDVLNASAGAFSFIALTGNELVAYCEIIIAILLIPISVLLGKRINVPIILLALMLLAWLLSTYIIFDYTNKKAKYIADAWDASMSELVKLGTTGKIPKAEWQGKATPEHSCKIENKKQLGMFPELFEYKFLCEKSSTVLIARLSLNLPSGRAHAWIKKENI